MFKLPFILFDDSGELGNRLVTQCLLLAACLRHGRPLVNLELWRYQHLFNGRFILTTLASMSAGQTPGGIRDEKAKRHTAPCWACRMPIYSRVHKWMLFDGYMLPWTAAVPRTLGGLLRQMVKSPLSTRLLGWLFDPKELVLDGHRFRLLVPKQCGSADLTMDYPVASASQFNHLFQLSPSAAAVSKAAFCDTLLNLRSYVGIHARRGDYRVYRGGRWFYEDSVYVQACATQLTGLPNAPGILISSNEATESLETFLPGSLRAKGAPAIVDLYLLGHSAIIIGPPSTFSGIASFLFGAPVTFIDGQTASGPKLTKPAVWVPQWY